jgi:hypothetical protein
MLIPKLLGPAATLTMGLRGMIGNEVSTRSDSDGVQRQKSGRSRTGQEGPQIY